MLDARAAVLARLKPCAANGRLGCASASTAITTGQVLRTEEDFIILDFEGEPARSLLERRNKQPPLKRRRGMLRSFSYAAYAALFAFTLNAPDEDARLAPWADAWQRWIGDAFLTAYRTNAGGDLVAADPAELDRLLGTFVLDKALYELAYELNNRPDWIRIPLVGILQAL